jgi:hypothetical protein
VYERLGIKKESAAAYRHNSSGMVERAIQTLLTLLSCTLAGELHHSSWLQRLPAILWTMNSSVSAATGYSPYYLEHGREPRSIESRALDTSDLTPGSAKWADTIRIRLQEARAFAERVDVNEKAARVRIAAQPKAEKKAVPQLEPGSYVYHQVERFSRDSADGAKLVPTFQGPYLVRDRVAGSNHRYLLSRTQTSALFEAHITRLKAAPAQTFDPVVLSSMASDFSGAG